MAFDTNTHTKQQLTGARFGGVTVHFGKFHLKVCHGNAVFFAHFWQRINTVTLLLHLPQFTVAHDHCIDEGEFLITELVLA